MTGSPSQPGTGPGTEPPTARQIFAAYLEARRRGEGPDFDQCCRDHPEQAAELRAWQQLVHAADAIADSPSFQQRLIRQYGEQAAVTVTLPADLSEPETLPDPGIPAAPDAARPARFAERYVVETEVARGGMGIIYRIRDRQLNRILAMKVRSAGKERPASATEQVELARFLEEAQVTAQLDHPGIVAVHDLGLNEEGQLYFTMKLVKGRHLGKIFELARKGDGGWNLPRAVGVLVKACHALAYAHSKGVIHRDLKPANIMVGRFGEVYLMDWGLAKVLGREDLHDLRPVLGSEMTLTSIQTARETAETATPDSPLVTMDGSVVGTPAYMSPEQAQGRIEEVDSRSDVYSMGAILYSLLTGHPPYVEPGSRLSPHTVLALVIQGPPKAVFAINRGAPPELVAICEKAMHREKARRYASSFELAEDLQAFLDHRVVRAYRTGAPAEFRSWVARNRLAASLAAVTFAGVILASAFWTVLARESALRAREELARNYLRQGQQLCEAGDVHAGLLWLARGLRECPPRNDALARVIRMNLSSWSRQTLTLEQVFEHTPPDPSRRLWPDLTAPLFAIRSDGKRLVSVDRNDQTARFWSLETGTTLGHAMAHPAAVREIFYTGADDRVVTLTTNGTVRWWNVSGEPLGDPFALEAPVRLSASLAAHELLAAWLANDSIQVWRVTQPPTRLLTWQGTNAVTALEFCPDGTRLIAAYADGHARIFSLGSNRSGETMLSHGERVTAAAISPDSQILATGGEDRLVRLWSVESGEPVGQELRQAGRVRSLLFSPDGQVLAVTVRDGFHVQLWAAVEGLPLTGLMAHQSAVTTRSFSPDSRYLATGGQDFSARVWSVDSGQPRVKAIPYQGTVGQVAFTPDGERLLVSSMGAIEVWAFKTPENTTEFLRSKASQVWSVNFSPDGTQILLAGSGATTELWSSQTRQLDLDLSEGNGLVWNAVFTPDGERILKVGYGGIASLWSRDGQRLRSFEGDPRMNRSCAVDPSGERVAIGSFEKVARVFSMDTGERLAALEHPDIVEDLEFHPTAPWLVTGCGDGKVRLWSLVDTNLVYAALSHDDAVLAVTFSPDGSRIASGSRDATARFWETATGRSTGPILQHQGWVEDLAFSRDGQWLVSGCADGTAHLWSVTTGEEVGPALRHPAPVRAVTIDPANKMILVAGEDPRVAVWRMPELLAASRENLESWIERVTGSRLSPSGALTRVPYAEWRALR